jgi:7-cyano-7-deazaguanine synthase in queuosine biosynthesis
LKPDVLGRYCFKEISTLAEDLIIIAGVIAFADRAVARKASISWLRQIDVTIPVLEPDFWRQPQVIRRLLNLLNLLTGDAWSLHFSSKSKRLDIHGPRPLSLSSNEQPIVMPYSDGMDSLAVSRLLANENPDIPLLMVTAGSRLDADKNRRENKLDGRRVRLAVPFQISQVRGARLRESSYRTRALIYGVMGAIAAQLSGASRVMVAESGQGALGPWLVPVGNEAPDIRMHPTYTSQLAEFVNIVLDTQIAYEHPRLWSTKGQTLRELADRGLAESWHETRSCARDARHMSYRGTRLQCGVCAACLLRRMSIHTAGLEESLDGYVWQRLDAIGLNEAVIDPARVATKGDHGHAVCGALAMAQLAYLADPSQSEYVHAKAQELARIGNEDIDQVNAQLTGLIRQHAAEWNEFVNRQGASSYLAQFSGGME